MNVKLVHARHRDHGAADARTLTYAEFPIEQWFASDDPLTQQQLMQQASQGAPDGDRTRFLADCNGLRVLARSEAALARAAGTLRNRFGARLVVGAPTVRYAGGPPVLEPYMTVLVNAPPKFLPAVRNDFNGRRGRITRIVERGTFVLEGEAPLVELLGYQDHLQELLGKDWRTSHVATWLSRYVPIDGHGPHAA